jgi:hypothetical protein
LRLDDGQFELRPLQPRASPVGIASAVIGGLAANGSKFVQDLIADEAASRRRKGKFVLEAAEADLGDTTGKLRTYLEELEKKPPDFRPLKLKGVADASVVRGAYLYFLVLSSDSAHVSADSLARHIVRDREGYTIYLQVNVAPDPKAGELRQTLEWLCALVLGVCIRTNDVLGGTPVGAMLRNLASEFDSIRVNEAPGSNPAPDRP